MTVYQKYERKLMRSGDTTESDDGIKLYKSVEAVDPTKPVEKKEEPKEEVVQEEVKEEVVTAKENTEEKDVDTPVEHYAYGNLKNKFQQLEKKSVQEKKFSPKFSNKSNEVEDLKKQIKELNGIIAGLNLKLENIENATNSDDTLKNALKEFFKNTDDASINEE